ncbi:AMP-binding protein [Amycolatopsis nigrescens]|uniref:AMP-binding protein n=1 Tax=Amycolatopsis nigrescens TaxID=381445 RepID=UPI00039D10D7|nr:AMP-binding protein [Amycolatopsis nigrescens]
MSGSATPPGSLGKVGLSTRGMSVLVRNGVVRPMGPGKLFQIHSGFRKWGLTLTLAFTTGAVRYPGRPAIIDDQGSLSYAELDQQSTRLAHGLRSLATDRVTRIGLLARNHRGAVQTCIAAGKTGADVVLLNTGLSAAQMRAVVEEQQINLLVVDQDLLPLVAECPPGLRKVVGWTEGPVDSLPDTGHRWHTLESLMAAAPGWDLPSPSRHGKTILLTSGTTGTPKGARRPDPRSLTPIAAMLDVIPLLTGDVMLLAPPLFHILAYGHLQLGALLGHTFVLRRKFDPERTLHDLGDHKATVLVAPPVMLQRMLELPAQAAAAQRGSRLRVVCCGGSALPGRLATSFMEVFGSVLYNLYGSTEVSWATIATPRDLAAADGTAGKPPRGTRVAVLDSAGKRVGRGEVGRIFVRNGMLFDGYTRPGMDKEVRRGLMSTGDMGYFDEKGRLFVVGRDDDMIISGGENVFPREVEDLLSARRDVREVAAVGVSDERYGQRLAVYVVVEPGHYLTAEDIREYVKRNLAKFSVPRDVMFLNELPRSPAGKVIPRDLPLAFH